MPNVTLLSVPLVLQSGPGADRVRNDCGAACVAMLVQAYTGKQVSVDEVYSSISATDRYLAARELMSALSHYGIESAWLGMSIADVFLTLVLRMPVIALIQYAPLRDAKLTTSQFGGPHFVVVIGIDLENVYINDPLNDPAKMPLAVPLAVWMAAWRQAGVGDNPANHVISPAKSLPAQQAVVIFPLKYRVTAKPFLNVRVGPGLGFKVESQLDLGSVVDVLEIQSGWARIGNGQWCSTDWLKAL